MSPRSVSDGLRHLRLAVFVLIAINLLAAPVAAQSGQPTATLTADAPVFASPNTNLTPLLVGKQGSVLRLLDMTADWVHVEYNVPQVGLRTGYVQRRFVRVQGTVPPPPPSPNQPRQPTATQGKPSPPKSTSSAANAWNGRVRIGISASAGASSQTFSGTETTPVYVESATFTTAYKASASPGLDVGAMVRVSGGFGIGAAVSWSSGKHDDPVTGTVPHPFFFNTLRPVSGSAAGLTHSEFVTHVQAVYLIRAGKNLDVAITGGPSIFNISQDLVSGVAFTETYPYDTATFASATVTNASNTGIGFNIGTDVTVRVARNVGVGALVRYSHASVTLASPSGDVASDGGGIQIGGGIRLLF